MSTNNPYDERDICTGVANDSIHQLNKLDKSLGNRKRRRIYPLTYIQAVFDAKSGTRLDAILDMVNSIYLPWKGTARATRIQVPFKVRRKGLMISYRNIDNEIITEKCITDDCVKDDIFGLDSSWVLITDALPISGNVTIGSNGNWFVDGEDTGFKAQGPKGENGVPLQPRLSEDKTKIEYSLDGEVWQELFPLDLVTPTIEFSEPVGLEPGSTPTVTNIGDDYKVNLQLGLPKAPSVSVGSTTTIGEGNQAKVTNSGTPYAPVLNFQIPKGDTGRGITILGFQDTFELLKQNITEPEIGDVYCVGTTDPYHAYVWTNIYNAETQETTQDWKDLGQINKDTTVIVNDLGDREDVAMSQKGISNVYNNLSIKIIENNFAISPDIIDGIEYNAITFFGSIIKKVRVRWDKNTLKDQGQKWTVSYLYVKSVEDSDPNDGLLQFSQIIDGEVYNYRGINIYDYGYYRGYSGLLEIKNAQPFGPSISFDLTLDCSAIELDVIYRYGNTQDSLYAGKIWILPELYYDTSDITLLKDSYFYNITVNKGKDYPIEYEDGVSHILNNFVLDASLICENKYRVNIAYINRTTTNTELWDNTIGFHIFDNEGNRLTFEPIYFKHDIDIQVGKTGLLYKEYNILDFNLYIRIVWYLDEMPNQGRYGVSSDQEYYNKIPFSESVYIPIPRIGSEDSYYYNIHVNYDKDFPVWIDPEVQRDNTAISYLRKFLLDAIIITSDEDNKYTYEVAYFNRNEVNEGQYDNSIQLVRRERENLSGSFNIITINHIDDIKNGNKFWFTYKWGNDIIRLYLDASVLPQIGNWKISNGASDAPANDGKQYIEKYCYLYYPSSSSDSLRNQDQIAKVVGEKLYIGSKFDEGNDILITFEKCMFNNLMTFSKVGLSENKYAYPLPDADRYPSEILNSATSDNIGPINLLDGGWCGGNHSYKDEGKVKTAETISFGFYSNGKKLSDGDTIVSKSIEVRVKNRIYNPSIAPSDEETILKTELCIEDVIYKIENGSILVYLSHTYTNENPVTVSNYYGMQSMCAFEDYIMTPNGLYNSFTTVSNVTNFSKSSYPNFNRFIETNIDKTKYQATYLLNYKDGNHSYLSGDNSIFIRSSEKCYHNILRSNLINKGDIIEWAGVYTWFIPIIDNDDILIYMSKINNSEYLFIDIKKTISKTYIEMPTQLIGKNFKIVEKSDSITFDSNVIGAKGIEISSSSSGVLILSFDF